jgi:hypothetical protein
MAAFDLPPQLILPRPAIIRPATPELIRPADPRFQQTVQALTMGQKRHRGRRRAAAALTWAFVGSCTSTGTALDFSALSAGSIQADDLAIFVDYPRHGSVPTAVTPSGFTNRVNTPGTITRGMLSDKKLLGSEGSVTGMDGSSSDQKVGLVFRPSISFASIAPSTPTTEVTSGNPVSQVIDPSAETASVIVIGVVAAGGGIAFSTATPAFDAEVTAGGRLIVGYKIYNASPQSHTIDMNDLGTDNWLAGIYYKVS